MTLNVRIKKITTKHGEAIFHLPLHVSGANCTDLVLVVIERIGLRT